MYIAVVSSLPPVFSFSLICKCLVINIIRCNEFLVHIFNIQWYNIKNKIFKTFNIIFKTKEKRNTESHFRNFKVSISGSPSWTVFLLLNSCYEELVVGGEKTKKHEKKPPTPRAFVIMYISFNNGSDLLLVRPQINS